MYFRISQTDVAKNKTKQNLYKDVANSMILELSIVHYTILCKW